MSNYHIRVSRSYEQLQSWLESDDFGDIVVWEHEADEEVNRTHIHAYSRKLNCTTDTHKNHIRKLLNEKQFPKTDWYFTTVNKHGVPWTDEVMTYQSKGMKPKFIKGFTEEEVESFRVKWVPPPNPITTQDGKLVVKRVVKETTKKTKRELIQEMLETYLPEMTEREIIELIRKTLIKNNEVLGMYKVIDFYDSLLCYGNKEEFVRMILQKINSRIRV